MMSAEPKYPYTPQEDDLAVVGYPKSGNNLLLFRIVRLRYGHRMEWSDKFRWVQIIGGIPTADCAKPRLLWTHEAFRPDFPRVVYVVRDPRDVVVSFYHHNQKFYGPSGWSTPFSIFFEQIVNGSVWPGCWERHVESWLAHKSSRPDDVFVVRYEDLVNEPVSSTQKLSAFLNCGADEHDIEDAVEWSTFSNMRRLEDAQSGVIDAAIKGPRLEERLHFVRHGKARQWENMLSVAQREQAADVWGDTMLRLGYTW